ncbi:MAG: glycoside hydrolase family 16 protein [Algoriphagus sp.]|uniref:glycoside hydrolase family 16 protein n=1 Tax=Algoriphagus sp. TaxID=1872435 RepID=UPI00183214B2|nr:glycoside hydrolase family 16 protein [Algoriphagus sp.]NVJ87564.1 glycoside hydrolase family 16 protein [Algoriphagus sp.]
MKTYFLYATLSLGLFFAFSSNTFPQKLLWSDEFDSSGLPDSTKWTYDVGDHGWGNQELQFYTEKELRNARVENGYLIIEAHADAEYPKGYTSARLVTRGKASWEYGYIEVRAKLPAGTGTWPAIWMLAEENRHGGWPKNGEIDIMEHVGYDPGVIHGTVHTEAFNHVKGTQKGAQIQIDDFDQAFHTYAINWTQESIEFYVDGAKYFEFENTGGDYSEWPFNQPFHLILNIAVGGTWGGQKGVDASIWPQRMVVDYVRVYDSRPNF